MGNMKQHVSDDRFDQHAIMTDIVDTRPTQSNESGRRAQRAISEVGIVLEDNRFSQASMRMSSLSMKGDRSPVALYLNDSSVFSTPKAGIDENTAAHHQNTKDPDD